MEKMLDQSTSAKNQEENLSLNFDFYGAPIVSSVQNEAAEIINEERSKTNLISGETQISENCDTPLFFKESNEKVSLNLLESAFKVMKTLFSPENPKNKTSNTVNQQTNILESSSNNLSKKENQIILEPEIEIPEMKSPFPEENDSNDKKQLSIPILHPLPLEIQSNDDDSFFTTVSYDESFMSAVTHFDENDRAAKTCDNLCIFNSSQDLDTAESCNSSLENSKCFLENTMLKNNSISSKEINHNGFSVKHTNESNEVFNGNNIEVPNSNFSSQTTGIQIEVFKANDSSTSTQTSNTLVAKISDLNDETSAVSNDTNELSLSEGEPDCGGTLLKKENHIPDQLASQEFQQHPKMPQLKHSSSNGDSVNTVLKNKVVCTENINRDLANMETDDKLTVIAEKSILQNKPERPPPYLFKCEWNEVDQMLLSVKNDSETIKSMNSLNKNAIFTSVEDACIMKSSDLTCGHQNSAETKENMKPGKQVILNKSRSDESKEISHKRIPQKFSDKNNVFHETQPTLASSQKEEGEKLIEFQKQDQNKTIMDESSNLNFNQTKVSIVNNEEVNFEENDSAHQDSVCNSPCVKNSEVVEENDSESTNLVGETENGFFVKHSTPVSISRNSSVSSSNEKLNINSLEANKESGSIISSEVYSMSSDFLSKAMGIFFEPSNPSLSGESIGYNSSTTSSKAPKQVIGSPVITYELNKSPMQNAKEQSESPSSSAPNPTCGSKNLKNQKEVLKEKLEALECEQAIDEKSWSFDSVKSDLNETVKVRQPVNLNQSKNSDISTTSDKIPDNGESHVLGLTFSQNIDINSEENEPYDTYNKYLNKAADSTYNINDANKILEKTCALEFISDKERSGLLEPQEANNFLSPIKELPEPISQTFSVLANESLTENNDNNLYCIYNNEENRSIFSSSFSTSLSSGNSSLLKNQISTSNNQVMENLSVKLKEMNSTEEQNVVSQDEGILSSDEVKAPNFENILPSELAKNIEPYVAQLIEEQFTPNDVAKICDIANLSESFKNENVEVTEDETGIKVENVLSPKSFDFLNSIQGKPTGRDLSRESLYVKFDPLVQPSSANSLIDFTKEVEALAGSETSPAQNGSGICQELFAISPEKKSDAIVPPLTPLSDRNKKDKVERQKELQNEIYFLKNLYSERERVNKAKMEDYETQIAKLTGDKCVLEDKLKEYAEREKCLVKKMTAQTREKDQLKVVMKEYVKVITVLTSELEKLKTENAEKIASLTAEKESYMNHLVNTEAAFSDVHTKYEKSKKMIEGLKLNEISYRNTISEYAERMKEYMKKAEEVQEKVLAELQQVTGELQESKNIHSQDVSRLRAQLKKTELKAEALQKTLDQKVKENQQLTAICDELIEGKK